MRPSWSVDICMQDLPNVKSADDKFNIPEYVNILLGENFFKEFLNTTMSNSSNA